MTSLKLKKALLVVDVQNDFCPGGALGIHDGHKIIPILNKYIKFFKKENFQIFVTRDWHPKVTKHFKQFGGVWPEHCVEGSPGAQFHPDLVFPKEGLVMSKGMDPEKDSYSAFQATDLSGTVLANLLKISGVTEIYIGGLATDYCVKYSALDALKEGLKVFILTDAIAGVNLQPEDSSIALDEMVGRGAKDTIFEKVMMVSSQQYSPTMTKDYSQISDTARAVDAEVLPRMASYIRRISPQIAAMSTDEVFVIADYGAADGVNSSELFEAVIRQIHGVNPTLTIKLVYIDLADPANFEKFWATSALAKLKHVEAQYIQRSFYEPFPEITGKLWIGFSSTALHWLNAKTVGPDYFQHPLCIQPNQLPDSERRRFAEKWKADWRSFLHECSTSLVKGGALFFANLANLGDERWPASPGYNNLRDICQELCGEKKLSEAELNAIFIPDYFATPHEMSSLMDEDDLRWCFAVNACDPLIVPCAYFTKAQDKLDDPQERSTLAATLAHVVRAWSESSMRIGLHADNKDLIEDIYRRLRDKFYDKPEGLPYQYSLLELVKNT